MDFPASALFSLFTVLLWLVSANTAAGERFQGRARPRPGAREVFAVLLLSNCCAPRRRHTLGRHARLRAQTAAIHALDRIPLPFLDPPSFTGPHQPRRSP